MEEDKKIMVVPREKLFSDGEFQGFKPHTKDSDYEQRILSNSFFHPRQDAEDDPSLKQPIGYCVIYNPSLDKIFLYRRSKKDKDYAEKRLQGKYSIGIGGHIEEQDVKNPVRQSTARELAEEIGLVAPQPRILGYINDDSNKVGSVHFGLLYLASTEKTDIQPTSREINSLGFKSLEELETLVNSPEIETETWSEIAMQHLPYLIKK